MIEIRTFTENDTNEIIQLVLHCQNDGTRPMVTVEDQPELLHIKETYLDGGGNFWVAVKQERVVGSIGLMDCGGGLGLIKKFFVYEEYRGEPVHLGRRLYDVLVEFARQRHIKSLLLDTPKNTGRAHRFYEKAGFQKIGEDQLPLVYDHPYEDSDFYILDL